MARRITHGFKHPVIQEEDAMTRVAITFLTVLVLTSGLSAQIPAGYHVFPSTVQNAVLVAAPGGSPVTTFQKLGFQPQGLAMAPNNRDLAVSSGTGFVARITPGNVVLTLAQVPVSEKFALDQDGSFLLPGGNKGSGSVLHRLDPGLSVTTIAAGFGTGKGRVVAVDVDTGDYLVGDYNVFRITRAGVVTTLAGPYRVPGPTDFVSDPRSGFLVVGSGRDLVTVDPISGAVATLVTLPATVVGVAVDRTRDLWVVAGNYGRTANADGVYTVDRNGVVVSLARLRGLQDAVVYGSRNVIAVGDPSPGKRLALTFSEPGSAGAVYVAAASFSARPGIALGSGTMVDLAPDSLFFFSQSAPLIFGKFQGILNSSGAAGAYIRIPNAPGLSGFRFFVSFVTVASGKVKAVARTQGYTIL